LECVIPQLSVPRAEISADLLCSQSHVGNYNCFKLEDVEEENQTLGTIQGRNATLLFWMCCSLRISETEKEKQRER